MRPLRRRWRGGGAEIPQRYRRYHKETRGASCSPPEGHHSGSDSDTGRGSVTPDPGQTPPKWVVRATSAYPPIATTERTQRDVSNVASAEIAALFHAIVWQLTPIAAPARRSHHTSLRIGGAS